MVRFLLASVQFSIVLSILIFGISAAQAAPQMLFHAGDRLSLSEDIEAHTVPQTAWDQYIVGKTNFDLPNFRKGLYGAERLADINLYLAYELLAGHRPWVMSIAVSSVCQASATSFNSEYVVFPQGSSRNQQNRFSAWYWAQNVAQIPGADKCLEAGSDRSYWDDQALYDLHSLPANEQSRLAICNDVMDRFLTSQQIRVLVDPVNDESWYLRDRECIGDIRGSANELFDRLLNNGFGDLRDPVSSNWYGNLGDPGSTYSGHTIFVLTVLSESRLALGEAGFAKMKVVTDDLDAAFGVATNTATLNLDHNADNPQIVSLAFKSMEKAARAGQLGAWQASLATALTQVVSDLGRACQGHHGVAAANQEACEKTSSAASAQLMQAFSR